MAAGETIYHINGKELTESQIREKNVTGISKTFHENGIIKSIEGWIEGDLNGPYESFDDKGRLKYKGNYYQNKMYGRWEYYSADFWDDDKDYGLKNIIVFKDNTEYCYFLNNKIQTITRRNENNKLHGIQETYYDNGQLKEIETWENGQLNGPTKGYEKDGTLKFKGQYLNGERHGEWEIQHNGTTMSGRYLNGKEIGVWVYSELGLVYGTKEYRL